MEGFKSLLENGKGCCALENSDRSLASEKMLLGFIGTSTAWAFVGCGRQEVFPPFACVEISEGKLSYMEAVVFG